VTEDVDEFVEAATEVAFECDGAILVSTDGTVQRRMVRIKSPSPRELEEGLGEVQYADWMGTKHLSAAEVSVRPEVFAAVTLSEEDGRVSVFKNGTFVDYTRSELGGPWRSAD
jgi:DNA integrity scanning protein DisA with diadenylate cyclase activity